MKLRLFSFLALSLALTFTSCTDECENVECFNGGVCESGTCDCPEGFTGSDCSEVATNEGETLSGNITSDKVLAGNAIHNVNGYVFVTNGATLTIEPGAILKFAEGNETAASALIITIGSKIMAQGTANSPIIMTSVLDNISVGASSGTSLDENDIQKWGGLIVLGDAPVSVKNTDIIGNIEGIVAEGGLGEYGGSNAASNSGVISYVSVRHGGVSIGDDNEINGITLGGVGTGTTVNNVEVVANFDDGIECFGGTVNISNALVAYQGDDAIDLDQNYSGTIDNFVVIQGAGGDEALEIDGPEGSTYVDGLFTLSNGTIINDGAEGSVGDLKSKAQGNITGVSIESFASNLKIKASYDDNCAEKEDAYTHYLTDGTLTITGNELVGSGSITTTYTDETACEANLDVAGIEAKGAAENTASGIGADTSVFGWTWAAANGKL